MPPRAVTDYHTKYFAHELSRLCPSDSIDRLAGVVAGVQVDLNTHQVDAALFASRSLPSKGALLADEVGLGKTIEAGLVFSQRWAERRRRILVIVPSKLRKQWYQELSEKFFLPCEILETKSFNTAVRQGKLRPFETDAIVICSYQFANLTQEQVFQTLQALPASQRSLMTLVLRKPLALSTFAIGGALPSISTRLKTKIQKQEPPRSLAEELDQDYEALDETAEEWPDDASSEPPSAADRAAIQAEITDLENFARLATSITHNAKGKVLVRALTVAFAKARELGAAEKAIIFTESRRTRSYLLRVLADSPFKDGIVLFNGSNADDHSRPIYADWLELHQDTDRVTGSKSADMRSALVDYFREQGHIMIATEAGAEGIKLQFCSLVVNYDLPWNPQRIEQRIEQRIGRCHRYGQKHHVVVVNFLNRRNEADQRVYQLLFEKFQLFQGVFGASDEVFGAIESGVDFEKRINDIYHRRRKPEEIRAAFDQLQLEEKLAGQKQIQALESQRNEKRRTLFEAQDQVDRQRDGLIASIEGKLTQNRSLSQVYTIRWKLA